MGIYTCIHCQLAQFLKKRHRECKTNTGGSQLHQRLLVIRPIDCDTGNGCTKPNPKEYLHKDD